MNQALYSNNAGQIYAVCIGLKKCPHTAKYILEVHRLISYNNFNQKLSKVTETYLQNEYSSAKHFK